MLRTVALAALGGALFFMVAAIWELAEAQVAMQACATMTVIGGCAALLRLTQFIAGTSIVHGTGGGGEVYTRAGAAPPRPGTTDVVSLASVASAAISVGGSCTIALIWHLASQHGVLVLLRVMGTSGVVWCAAIIAIMLVRSR